MRDFWGFIFGRETAAAQRKVVGAAVEFGVQEAAYLKDANLRLAQLQDLCQKFAGTPQATRMRLAYEKTRQIHTYLVSRKKLVELELFHLQHTDHFLTTFSAIWQHHQDHPPIKNLSAGQADPEKGLEQSPPRIIRVPKALDLPEIVQPLAKQGPLSARSGGHTTVPRLYVPEVSINATASITFLHENPQGKLTAHHVCATSSGPEKEVFVQHVRSRLGLEHLEYVGNAQVTIPNENGITPTGLVPIIFWEGFLYALNLNDYRLFPVKRFRNRP